MAKFHELKIKDIRRETGDTVSIAFDVPAALAADFEFIQGQHLTLRRVINGEEIRRNYSICSGVGEGELRIAIKRLEGGQFSTFANDNLRVGDSLDVLTPSGHFFTRTDPKAAKNYVAFAAGNGITPVISIIKTVLRHEPKSQFTLIYGNGTVDHILFHEQLEDLKDRYIGRLSVYHILSEEQQDADFLNGVIDGEKCDILFKSLCPPAEVDEFFLCGPEKMINDVSAALEKAGAEKNHIHFELFTAVGTPAQEAKEHKPAALEAKGGEAKVTVILDGVKTNFPLPFNGDSVLDAALDLGLDLPFACKAGVCCTCRAKLVEGKVDMAVNYSLEPEEVAAGFILTCQSRPLTDRVVIDYDHV
jgi:ring-1,2-phenylacetyl-CoA epoxidase subunit PaaE